MKTKLIHEVRAVKNKKELVSIIKAQRISEKVLLGTLKYLRTGVSELQIEFLIKKSFIKHGAPVLSFPPIVVYGSAYIKHDCITDFKSVVPGLMVNIGCVFAKSHNGRERKNWRAVFDKRFFDQKFDLKLAYTCS